MKAAIILPQKFLKYGEHSDYHMALAHLIGKDGFEDYTKFYRGVGLDPNKFLIMDTGLIEGDARPTEELIEKAAYLNASEMALNDVFMDREGTLVESAKALELVKRSGVNVRTMGIPQGNCMEDWVACAKEMLTWDIDTIGVPKVLVKLEGRDARITALRLIKEDLIKHKKDVHLLGCWESPIELSLVEAAVEAELIVPVRGVDSAIAYAYARESIRITDDERPEGAINFAAESCDEEILKYNIAVYELEATDKATRRANKVYHIL